MLKTFTCTEPEGYAPGVGKTHPAKWELKVQSSFRDARFPLVQDCRILIYTDDSEISAASRYVRGEDPNSALIQGLAVSKAHRGLGLGKYTLGLTFAAILRESWVSPMETVYVWAKAHEMNVHSQRVCGEAEMKRLPSEDDPPYQVWAIILPALAG
ncbi:hypothetical protein [Isoptericola sp. NPDC058082]|uniref:hypothetical protein n=1 Tax=Isoptericola sp. NPDC058082 TaxID=3346331 RepID=UPI0036E20021